MDTCRSSRLSLRQLAFLFALAAALLPSGIAEAASKKVKPVVTSVRPMDAEVGDTLSIHGKNFRPGRGTNTVVFKRDGYKAVFVKADVATRRLIKVKVPASLEEFMVSRGTVKIPTVFRIRILAKRFGKSFTPDSSSPKIGPDTPPPPPPPPTQAKAEGDCDGNGVLNKDQGDDDSDGLTDAVELSLGLDPCVVDSDKDGVEDRWEFDCDRNGVLNRDEDDDDKDRLLDGFEGTLMTDPCAKDTDADGVEDGFEYRSAVDLNDDEYQQPNTALPYPRQRPYPNPLWNGDGTVDYDGDGLSQREEQGLWRYTHEVAGTATSLSPLSYSDGLQASVHARCQDASGHPGCGAGDANRRVPTIARDGYDKWTAFLNWAAGAGYRTVRLNDAGPWWDHNQATVYGLLDVNRDGVESSTRSGHVMQPELFPLDTDNDGYMSDDERDEDADGLSNWDEIHSRMLPKYWEECYQAEKPYQRPFDAPSATDADSDDDGVRDGADDADADDVPNLMELSRINASGLDDTEDGVDVTFGVPGRGASICNPDDDLPEPPAVHHPDAYGWVNPYNPCLPFTWARSCRTNFEFDNIPAPFNEDTPNWWSLN